MGKRLFFIFLAHIAILGDSIQAQQVSNFAEIWADKVPGGGIFDQSIRYTQGDNYDYLSFKAGENIYFYNDTECLSLKAEEYSVSNTLNIFKIDKGNNQFLKRASIHLLQNPPSSIGNLGSFDSHGIEAYGDKLYIYGSVYRTDSMYVNGMAVSEVDTTEAFILVFNEDLELIDELHFGNDKLLSTGIYGLKVNGSGIHISGRFKSSTYKNFIKDYSPNYMEILGDTLWQDKPKGSQTHFYALIDMEHKRLKRSFIYSDREDQYGTYQYDFDVDNEDNMYVACVTGGNFYALGQYPPIDRSSIDDVLVMSVDSNKNIRYMANHEGWGYQGNAKLCNCNDGFNYELVNAYLGPTYINYDTIDHGRTGIGYIIKRRKDGNMEWLTQMVCDTSIGLSNIYCCEDKILFSGGSLPNCLEQSQENWPVTYSDGFFGIMNKENGAIEKRWVVHALNNIQYAAIREIIYLGKNKYRLLVNLGGGELAFPDQKYIAIAGQKFPIRKHGSIILFDFEAEIDTSVDIPSILEQAVYPNPVLPGEQIMLRDLNKLTRVRLIDLSGHITLLNASYQIPMDVPSGMYILQYLTKEGRIKNEKIIIH